MKGVFIMNNMIPNRFPVQGNQESVSAKKPSGIKLSDINWRGVAGLILVVLVGAIAFSVIKGLSEMGSGFGGTVMEWLNIASINPKDKQGFRAFLCLVLVAGFICLILHITKRKNIEQQ
jgi:hypothetical protein